MCDGGSGGVSAAVSREVSTAAQARFAIGLDLRQGRLVREALEERPYREVEALVARLDAWAGQAFGPGGSGAPFVLDHGELVVVVDALADLPYRRVHALVQGLEQQIAGLRAPARVAA
jgi:hypothetical protein